MTSRLYHMDDSRCSKTTDIMTDAIESQIASPTSQEDRWLAQFRKKVPEILSERDLRIVCQRVCVTIKNQKVLMSDYFQVKSILIEENNVQPVPSPVVICGDIHGQFFDLLKLLSVGGEIPETNYIFLVRLF